MYVTVIRRYSGQRTLYEATKIEWAPHDPTALIYTEEGQVSVDREQITGLYVMSASGETIEKVPPMRRHPEEGLAALNGAEVTTHDLAEAMGER